MGSPIGMIHRDANQAQPGNETGFLPDAGRVLHGDCKHPVGLEGVCQHFPVTRLKNIEWEQRLGKERRTRKGHHRDLCRQIHESNLSFCVS